MIGTVLCGCAMPPPRNGADVSEKPASRSELDRLQRVINERADLEPVTRQLAELDREIRTTIERHSPATVLDPTTPKVGRGCDYPFRHNIGDSYTTETSFGRPAPTEEQWQQISTELEPAFRAAGFRRKVTTDTVTPPRSIPQDRADDAAIKLVNRPAGNDVLVFSYRTGCHLPAAWRTAPPPPADRPGNDPGVHYPYLYGPPGGRTAPAQ